MLTQRAVLLGFVAFCFYLIAVVNTLPSFFYVLMWLALGLLASSLGIAVLSLSGLEFSWSLTRSSGHAVLGEHNERQLSVPVIEATLRNRGSLNKTGLLIELYLREQERDTDAMLVYLLEAVPAGKTLDIALPLRELPRGCYEIRRARLVGSDVLGLFRARRTLDLQDENAQILVAPALLPPAPLALAGGAGRARRVANRRTQLGGGDELRGTRPYVAGDDMRQIHWKSTARTGELVMREWEQVGQGAAIIVWDGAQGSDWGAGALSSTECGLILVASLLATFAEHSLPCELAVLGESAHFCGPAAPNGAPVDSLSRDAMQALARARAARVGALETALDGVWKGAREVETLTLVSGSLRADAVKLVSALRARNIATRVALLNGAALGRASADPRFVGRRAAQKTPVQPALAGGAPLAVTDAAFARQKKALEQAGARVVEFAPVGVDQIWSDLQKVESELLAPNSSHVAGALAAQRARLARHA